MNPARHRPPSLDSSAFAAAAFPEQAFPPRPELAAAYEAACRRGYDAMAGLRVAITGLARDVGHVLPLTIRRIERLAGCFADYRVFAYENDSRDDTGRLLADWVRADRRVQAAIERRTDPVNPATRCLDRAARMAFYRGRCREAVLERCGDFDVVIVIDFDVPGGFSLDGVASTFGHEAWDFVGSNGLICRRRGLDLDAWRQYDTWALRFDAALTPLSTRRAGGLVYERGGPLVAVTSCFGGLGVYTMDAFRAGEYDVGDLEHAVFHRTMAARGHARLFLNPSQLVVYGRRHRFGDGLARLLRRGLSAVRGEPSSPAPAASVPPAPSRRKAA